MLLLWATQSLQQAVPTAYEPDTIDVEAAYDREVQHEIAVGNKIAAIRLYRELTGCSLREAKAAIDFLVAHPDYDLLSQGKHDPFGSPIDAGVRDLVRAGQRDEAMRIYRDFTGADAEDARAEIERIEWEETARRSRLNGRH